MAREEMLISHHLQEEMLILFNFKVKGVLQLILGGNWLLICVWITACYFNFLTSYLGIKQLITHFFNIEVQ